MPLNADVLQFYRPFLYFIFAAGVQVFLFASVRAFPSCPQRLGCHNDQNARWLVIFTFANEPFVEYMQIFFCFCDFIVHFIICIYWTLCSLQG